MLLTQHIPLTAPKLVEHKGLLGACCCGGGPSPQIFTKCPRQGGTQSRRQRRAGLDLGTLVLASNAEAPGAPI